MSAINKTPRSAASREQFPLQEAADYEDSLYDFGGPEVVSVEVAPGKFFSLREPVTTELITIDKMSRQTPAPSDVEITAQILCLLHEPEPGKRKITLNETKKLTSRQLTKLGKQISVLLGQEKESDESTSEASEPA